MLEYPENSEKSMNEIIKEQRFHIETDVHRTKDGVFITSHDSNLKWITKQDVDVHMLDFQEILHINENILCKFTNKIFYIKN